MIEVDKPNQKLKNMSKCFFLGKNTYFVTHNFLCKKLGQNGFFSGFYWGVHYMQDFVRGEELCLNPYFGWL